MQMKRKTLAFLFVALLFSFPVYATLNPVNVTNALTQGAGYGIVITNNYLYLSSGHFEIFDISNPVSPIMLSSIDMSFGGRGGGGAISLSGNYAYVVNSIGPPCDGYIAILDVSNPTNPTQAGVISGSFCDVTASGHYVYADAFIYDVSNPAMPLQIGQINGYGPTAIRGPYAYKASDNATQILLVYDISDPANPKQLNAGSPSISSPGFGLELSGDYAYVATYTNCGLAIFDISTPTNPIPVKCLQVWTVGLAVSGNYAYALGGGSCSIIDVSDPTNATRVADITGLLNSGMAVKGNYAYFATFGLNIYSLGLEPPLLSILSTPTNVLLSWPSPTGSFAIQQNFDLNPAHWTTLPNVSVVVGSQNQVNLSRPQGNMFYRLITQ